MSAGSVSTPSRAPGTGPSPTAPVRTGSADSMERHANAEAATAAAPATTGDEPDAIDAKPPRRITSKLPEIPHAERLARVLTGDRDLSPAETSEAILSALHGDMQIGASRSSRTLRDTGHTGPRDAVIGALERQRADLVAQAKAGKLGSGAAGAAAELADQADAQRGMNAMAGVMHALGADESTVALLDDSSRVRVVADGELAGNAGYDSETGAILVSRSLAERAGQLAERLRSQGMVDDDGNVLAGHAAEIDASSDADELAKLGSLIGVHEATHAAQHERGDLDAADGATGAAAHDALLDFSKDLAVGTPMGADDYRKLFSESDEAWAVEAHRVDSEEYEAYLAQERSDLELGATLRVQLVTHRDGSPLTRAQGVANIVALERGRPLPFGPDSGWMRPDAIESVLDDLGIPRTAVPWNSTGDAAQGGATVAGETPGWKRPGWKRPGWKRPGMLVQ